MKEYSVLAPRYSLLQHLAGKIKFLIHMKHNRTQTIGSYIDEAVYGANDGIVTTFAVVAGAAGASLGHNAIIVMGLANLIADGFSMGASSLLSIRTEADVARAGGHRVSRDMRRAGKRSLVTFVGFVSAGMLPLVPFLFSVAPGTEFRVSATAAGVSFFVVGGMRSLVTRRSFVRSGLEMLILGGTAASLAYATGWMIQAWVL